MNDLITYGFCFYLDDYGKGYSNIEYITNLPFEYIKIDKSLISSYSTNSTMKLFLDGIIEILKKTNRYVIVEGAETKEHVEILKNLKIKYVQGFYYQIPLSQDDMITKLKK
jgi:EAL domain-containing protein (putative c-di-GMP-specific phosphodiesterase class I)